MIKKLTKHGENWALIIEQPMLDLLRIDPEMALELSTDGGVLTVSPAIGIDRTEVIKASLEKVNQKYGRVLKKLAE